MNKTLLYTAMFTLLCTGVYADNTTQAATPVSAPPTATMPTPQPAPKESSIPSPQPAPQPAPVVDCQYRIPAETASVEQSLLSTWVEKAVVQSFDFNPATLDDQLAKLKLCFTDQGWQSYNDALQKSGNINAIKTQHLSVSSQTDGELKINPVKENQWKVTVPIQVVYQNDKEKITQLLSVDLLVGRKVSGDLGIMQIIATPRVAAGSAAPMPAGANPTPAAEDTAESSANPNELPPGNIQE